MVRAIFFDRDGVVNHTIDRGDNCIVDGKKVRFTAPWTYDEFKVKEGVEEIINQLKELGFLIILTTNQPDIAYKNLSLEDHNSIMADINKFSFDDIFVCTHGREDNCVCKKPKSGMLLEAAKKHNIDLESSFMIGDTINDVLSGESVGCKTILLNYEYNKGVECDHRIHNLMDIVRIIS